MNPYLKKDYIFRKEASSKQKKIDRDIKNESDDEDMHPFFDRQFMVEADKPLFRNKMHTIYEDGYVRKFGQTTKPENLEARQVKTQKGKRFIYETGDRRYDCRRKRNAGGKLDDTRSLYDDPKLQKMRQYRVKKLIQKSRQGLQLSVAQPPEECKWAPINSQNQSRRSPQILLHEIRVQIGNKLENISFKYYGPEQIEFSSIQKEYDAFKLFFDDEIYGMLVNFTKEKFQSRQLKVIYSYCNGLIKTKPYHQKWEIQTEEIDAYFAVILYFGIVRMSNHRDYWQLKRKPPPNNNESQLDSKAKTKLKDCHKDDIYAQWIRQRMNNILSYEKFILFKANLRFYKPEAKLKQSGDPIWKVRELMQKFNERFKKFYSPDEYLTIDEGMIPFNGSIPFKVYNPDKPTKWGIKEYILCDATNAYTLEIKLYHGQTMWSQEFDENILVAEESTSSRTMELVIQLLKNYENKGHKVVMDNYYTSWKLFRELKNRGIGALGTIRHNRTGMTKKDIVSKHFQQIYHKQNYAFYINQSKDCILLYFQGTSEKEVALISSYVDNSLNQDHHWDISKNINHPACPNQPYMVHLYNKYSGGVDRRNAFVSKHQSKLRRQQKWWQSVFDRVFETSVINGFLIYKIIHPTEMNQRKGIIRDYRVNLMNQLAERHMKYKQHIDEGTFKDSLQRDQQEHHMFIGGEELLDCVECGAKTKNFCQQCSILQRSIVGLCSEQNNIKCQRFHEFSSLNLDKNKISKKVVLNVQVYQRNRKGAKGMEREIEILKKKQAELEKQKVQLLANKCQNFQAMKNLDQIIELLVEMSSESSTMQSKQDLLNEKIKLSIELFNQKKIENKLEIEIRDDHSDLSWGQDLQFEYGSEGSMKFLDSDDQCSCLNENFIDEVQNSLRKKDEQAHPKEKEDVLPKEDQIKIEPKEEVTHTVKEEDDQLSYTSDDDNSSQDADSPNNLFKSIFMPKLEKEPILKKKIKKQNKLQDKLDFIAQRSNNNKLKDKQSSPLAIWQN